MKSKAIKKLKSRAGLTLVELLCTLVILTLVSGAMATGVAFGSKYYTKCVSDAQAQILSSTLTTLISDELRYATEITSGDAGITFFSQTRGTASFGVDGNGHLTLDAGTKTNEVAVGKGMYSYGVQVADLGSKDESDKTCISYTSGIFTVRLVIQRNGTTLCTNEFQVKPLIKPQNG